MKNTYQYLVVYHPKNELRIKDLLTQSVSKTTKGFSYRYQFVADASLPLYFKKWVFPKERFWSYNNSSESWCRFFGFGSEADDERRPYYFGIELSKL